MKIEVTVCNVCQRVDRPARPYGIVLGSNTTWVDLCDEDSAPLDELIGQASERGIGRVLVEPQTPAQQPPAPRTATKKASRKRATKKAAASRQRRAHVVSLDDIERAKKQA